MAAASKVVRSATPRKPPNAGKGRKKGVPNRVPAQLKEALRLALDGFATEIPTLLQKVARKDPARALELVARLGEYVVPKLGRTEHSLRGRTLEELVAGTERLAADRALEALPAAPGSYAVPLDAIPARLPELPATVAEPEASERPSDTRPQAEQTDRTGLAAGERTVADLRAKARQSLLAADYDPYQTY